ncbi:MAG: hypothetical protein A2X49_00410 [Lentisphaerae bacterium GWF2_52_8]|nr:MAG: hypothetical protein A2X49_00410 [Lentisphaerae bacterium GWF2_52_8]
MEMSKFGKQDLISILKESGVSEESMKKVHCLLEAKYPETHQKFLEALGIDATEIREIRKFSAK